MFRAVDKRRRSPLRALAIGACAAALLLMLPGCIKLAGRQSPRRAPTASQPPAPQPTPQKTQSYRSPAFDTLEQFRKDLLKHYQHIGSVNCAFAIGVDVSGSAHSDNVLEYAVDLLHDMSMYFFDTGDEIVIVPWDSTIRKDRIKTFAYTDAEDALSALNEVFEDLERLVDPESRGSNVLDARGFCMEQALRMSEESGGKLCPAVIILSDTYISDIAPDREQYKPDRLQKLRVELAGADTRFYTHSYETGRPQDLKIHLLAGPADQYDTVAGIDRLRRPGQATVAAPQRPTRPRPPPDTKSAAGWQTLLIVLALIGVALLIALPFAWTHQVTIGEQVEKIRAIGGDIVIESGEGISPAGVVYLPVRGLEDRPLATIQAKGPQLLASARRGVRLNEGRTELVIPAGRKFTLRITVDGVPGEQTIDIQAIDFFSTNAAALAAMGIALLVIIGCIIG